MQSLRCRALAVLAVMLLRAPDLCAQQDGLVAYPNVYRVQFENDWVRLVRVKIPENARLNEHTHPAGVMIHVYLTDADPITFIHEGGAGTVTRPYVYARSLRIGHTRDEVHAVMNIVGGASEYMRVEFKTVGEVARPARIPAVPVGPVSTMGVEYVNDQFRVTRLNVAPRDSAVVAPAANEPSLLIALSADVSADGAPPLSLGQERFVDGGKRVVIRPRGFAPVQFLRVDFLTRPTATPK